MCGGDGWGSLTVTSNPSGIERYRLKDSPSSRFSCPLVNKNLPRGLFFQRVTVTALTHHCPGARRMLNAPAASVTMSLVVNSPFNVTRSVTPGAGLPS